MSLHIFAFPKTVGNFFMNYEGLSNVKKFSLLGRFEKNKCSKYLRSQPKSPGESLDDGYT